MINDNFDYEQLIKKLKENVRTIYSNEEVLIRNTQKNKWVKDTFISYDTISNLYKCKNKNAYKIIPYKGNEKYEGTKDNIELKYNVYPNISLFGEQLLEIYSNY